MKRISIILLLVISCFTVQAQVPKSAQQQMEQAQKMLQQMESNPQYKAAMQKMHHIMDSVKSGRQYSQQMAESRHVMDSIKKANPALANSNMPGFNGIQMPNLDSINHSLDIASQQMQNLMQQAAQTTPKQDITHHAEKIPTLTPATLAASVNGILKMLKPKMSIVILGQLDAMAKNKKINVAGTGAFMLASGADKDAALYLICKGILINPKDPWAVNDLGVYYRDTLEYVNALKCFFYANVLDTGKSAVINTNIGWASAYYGDFDAAIKYFSKALAVNSDFTSASEGRAIVYYAEGNISALWNQLAKGVKKIKLNSSIMDEGLSDDFASTCANASNEQTINNSSQNSTVNPNDDHTFDNTEPGDDESQDPPPGAENDITYPQFKRVFLSDAKDVMNAVLFWHSQAGAIKTSFISLDNQRKQSLKSNDFLSMPYWDGSSKLVFPKTFSKFIMLFNIVEQQYEQRCDWYTKAFVKKEGTFQDQAIARDNDMSQEYNKEIKSNCGSIVNANEANACKSQVDCKWIPKIYHSKQNDLDEVAKMWDDFYDNIAQTNQWFINATAPFISRVHDVDWNQYLNLEREIEIRTTILNAYDEWITSIYYCYSAEGNQTVHCQAIEGAGITPPDPFSKSPKHIKEFEGPCYDITSNAWGTGISAEQTCHATTLSFGSEHIGAFYTHVTDQVYAQNTGYTN